MALAQASGLPVVSYSACAVPEVVEHGTTGWLVPKGDIQSLALAIERAVERSRQFFEMGLAGKTRAQARFTWENTATTILEKIRDLQNQRVVA